MKAVETIELGKTYAGGKNAVNNMNLSLNQGEVFGFLGPNGAGKTTTIKLLCAMLKPTKGSCRVFDLDPAKNPEKLHQLSGIITEHAQMYDYLSGLHNLIFYGTLFGLSESESEKQATVLLERLGLQDARNNKLSAYSTGMRQRLSLARAMIHKPKILFLDEPTSGLDPESAQNVNSLIGELADEGTTIFLCTHQLRYAQEICTTYGLIDRGSLLASGNIQKLREMVFSGLTVTVNADLMPNTMESSMNDDGSFCINVDSEKDIPAIARSIIEAGGNIYHISSQRMSLEEIYFSLIDRRKSEKERVNGE